MARARHWCRTRSATRSRRGPEPPATSLPPWRGRVSSPGVYCTVRVLGVCHRRTAGRYAHGAGRRGRHAERLDAAGDTPTRWRISPGRRWLPWVWGLPHWGQPTRRRHQRHRTSANQQHLPKKKKSTRRGPHEGVGHQKKKGKEDTWKTREGYTAPARSHHGPNRWQQAPIQRTASGTRGWGGGGGGGTARAFHPRKRPGTETTNGHRVGGKRGGRAPRPLHPDVDAHGPRPHIYNTGLGGNPSALTTHRWVAAVGWSATGSPPTAPARAPRPHTPTALTPPPATGPASGAPWARP